MPGTRMVMAVPMLMAACGLQADEPQARTGAQGTDPAPARAAGSDIIVDGVPRVPAARPLPAESGKLPPVSRKLRFAGRWAETLAQCRTRAWWLGEGWHGVVGPGGQRCDLQEISGGGSRYRAIAWCSPASSEAGRLSVGYSVSFTFDEAAQRMHAEGPIFPDSGLVFCGTEG